MEIWQLARELSIEIHQMTMRDLPKFEMYEVGRQIRRSMKSVRSNIVEGYGRRRYKAEWIRFLVYAESSCDETTDHLETLYETESLLNSTLYDSLREKLLSLARMLNRFLQAVEVGHVPGAQRH